MAQCGAKTRNGTPCKRAGMKNGRCKLHGGMSTGAPSEKMKGKKNAEQHGFFARVFPNNKEIFEIIESICEKEPADILWENIVIQYTAILRAQKIAFVRDSKDHSVFETKRRGLTSEDGETGYVEETEQEIQYAWDKHAAFLNAQSRAIATLDKLLERYENLGPKTKEHKLKMELIRAQLKKMENPDGDDVDDWITALETVAERRRKRMQENGT